MKRRNFITTGLALLAAPFSLFAKRSTLSKLYVADHGEPIDFDYEKDWVEGAARAEKYLEAEKKAAGPWRIVEQDKKGLVVLEREYGPSDFQGCVPLASVEFGKLKILDGKIQFTADFYCRSGKHEVVQELDEG